MRGFFMFAAIICLACPLGCYSQHEKSAERRLYEKLTTGYNPKIRPLKNSSHSVTVKVGITLAQLLTLSAKDQLMSTIVYFDQEWHDEYMVWDPADFGGLRHIMIPANELWHSDTTLYNSIGDFSMEYDNALASVNYNGTVFFSPIVKLDSICGMDIALFPFDDQTCEMRIASWMYDMSMVDVVKYKENVVLDKYTKSGEWDIVNTSVVRIESIYPCCPDVIYPIVTFKLHLRRRRVYYIVNLIVPCILLSMIAAFGILVPPETGEKVTVQVSVMMALMVYLVLLASRLPETSDATPLIGIYLVVVSCMITFSTIIAMFITCIHFNDGRNRAPKWIRLLVLNIFGKVICKSVSQFRITKRDKLPESIGSKHVDSRDKCSHCRGSSAKEEFELLREKRRQQPSPIFRCRKNDHVDLNNGNSTYDEDLDHLDHVANGKSAAEMTMNSRDLEVIAEWRCIGAVLDRILFIIVFFATAIYSSYFLLSSTKGKSLE